MNLRKESENNASKIIEEKHNLISSEIRRENIKRNEEFD